mmetsp:Transcript_40025/g.110209  ORF Transcript_40025/g.110209 Transcript_40025/m.110209 type:complete len:680 (-) Transcript_40025:171-2210(-)
MALVPAQQDSELVRSAVREGDDRPDDWIEFETRPHDNERPSSEARGDVEMESSGSDEGEIRRVWKNGRLPEVLGIVVEILFCTIITIWDAANNASVEGWRASGGTGILVLACWIVLAGFLHVRFAVYWWWRLDHRVPDSILTGIYMLASTVQFIVYMALYYALRSRWTFKTSASTEVSWSYAASDVADDIFAATCTPYDSASCDGRAEVGGVSCCLAIFHSLTEPVSVIPFLFGWEISHFFSTFEWLTILVMTWVWKDIPFIDMTASDKNFVNGAWLDILDAALFGGAFVMSPEVRFPAWGIVGHGDRVGRSLGENDTALLVTIFSIWLVAFLTSLLSPALYVTLGFLDTGDEKPRETVEDVTSMLVTSIKTLNEELANKLIHRAVRLQTKLYEEADGDAATQSVLMRVESQAGEADGRLAHSFRRGVAAMTKDAPGYYDVTFKDGLEPRSLQKVSITCFVPDFEGPDDGCLPKQIRGVGCCKGWFSSKFLSPENDKVAFERRAQWYDAFRSLLLLELPFACTRLYFELSLSGSVSILTLQNAMLLKNAVWGCTDLLRILSFGNDEATCCMFKPIRYMVRLVKGSKLADDFGPSGLVGFAADLATKDVKNKLAVRKQRILTHRAWLVLEREKVEQLGATEMVERYTSEIESVQAKIAEIEEWEEWTHTRSAQPEQDCCV